MRVAGPVRCGEGSFPPDLSDNRARANPGPDNHESGQWRAPDAVPYGARKEVVRGAGGEALYEAVLPC